MEKVIVPIEPFLCRDRLRRCVSFGVAMRRFGALDISGSGMEFLSVCFV
jgi:hypothetical protein